MVLQIYLIFYIYLTFISLKLGGCLCSQESSHKPMVTAWVEGWVGGRYCCMRCCQWVFHLSIQLVRTYLGTVARLTLILNS